MPLSVENLLSLEGCPYADAFSSLHYPWEILGQIPDLIAEILDKEGAKYDQIAHNVWVGKNTIVADTARFQGPVLIGAHSEIRPNAYLRPNVIAGDHVVVGNSTEIKQALLFDKVKVPHFNYVGDSVLGYGVHLGAGVILSNFKSTPGPIKVNVGQKAIETGLRKLGAVLGDGVEIGCNAVLNPGTVVGPGTIIYPLSSIRGYIPGRMIYKGPGNLVPLRG